MEQLALVIAGIVSAVNPYIIVAIGGILSIAWLLWGGAKLVEEIKDIF